MFQEQASGAVFIVPEIFDPSYDAIYIVMTHVNLLKWNNFLLIHDLFRSPMRVQRHGQLAAATLLIGHPSKSLQALARI